VMRSWCLIVAMGRQASWIGAEPVFIGDEFT